MIQYWIRKKATYRLMRNLYKKFLMEDKDWHFFFEDTYMLLRVKKRNKAIEKYFADKKIEYSRCVWVDAHPVVRKYQDIYKELFHGFSVLAMKVKKEEYLQSANRIMHCYCNMSWEVSKKAEMPERAVLLHLTEIACYMRGYHCAMWEMEENARKRKK